MAQNQSPAFFAVALLLIAAAAPLAIAQPPPALPIGGGLPLGPLLNAIQINGTLCCTPTGSCPGGPPLAGIPVTLTCSILGVNVNLGQAVTGVNGTFAITIGNLINTLLGPVFAILGGTLPCTVKVALPLSDAVCPLLNVTNSALTGVLTITNIVFSLVNGLLGIVTVVFRLVPLGATV